MIRGRPMKISNKKIALAIPLIKYCECGCGREVKFDKRFVVGHARKKYHPSSLPKLCECGCGAIVLGGRERRFAHAYNKGVPMKQEQKDKVSASKIGKYSGEKAYWFGKHLPDEQRKSHSIKMKKWWSALSDEKRQEICKVRKLYIPSEATRKKISATVSKVLKDKWLNDPEYTKMMGTAWRVKPNKPETFLLNLLNELYPGEWKYTGDFSFVINGKSPDFVNCNGKKLCIELFGNYWHRNDNPDDRAKVFEPFGYKILVIWEHELKDIEQLKEKLEGFCL